MSYGLSSPRALEELRHSIHSQIAVKAFEIHFLFRLMLVLSARFSHRL